MARWASLVEKRREERPVLLVDTGDFHDPQNRLHGEVKDRYFFQAMRLLRYDAVGIGEYETSVGIGKLLSMARGYDIPLVSSNILDKARKRPAAATSIVKDLGGTRGFFGRKGFVRVGIFSVTLPGYVYEYGMDVSEKYYVADPKTVALEATMKLRAQGCDLIVAVSHQGWEKSLELAKEVPGIDIVLNGHRTHKTVYEERVGSTVVVDTGEKQYTFAEVSVTFTRDSIIVTAGDVCSTALTSPGDARFLDIEKKYSAEMRRLNLGTKPK